LQRLPFAFSPRRGDGALDLERHASFNLGIDIRIDASDEHPYSVKQVLRKRQGHYFEAFNKASRQWLRTNRGV